MKPKCQEEKQRMVSRLYFLVSLLSAKRRKWVKLLEQAEDAEVERCCIGRWARRMWFAVVFGVVAADVRSSLSQTAVQYGILRART